MKTLKKIMMGLALISGLYSGSTYSQQNAEPIKASAAQTALISEDQRTLHRTELMLSKMPANSDVYMILEQKENSEVYKIRGQALPITTGPVSLGVTAQHVYSKKPTNDYGIVARLQGKIGDVSAKADFRGFKSNTYDGYMFGSLREVFIDMLWSYDANTGKMMFRSGVDYRITDNISVGIEGKVSGKIESMNTNYAALRIGVKI